MRQMFTAAIVLAVAVAPVGAQEKVIELKAPTPVVQGPIVIMPAVPYRVSQYAVWQYYAVDGSGRFRPRVIATPQGAYYMYNGMPYPTPNVRQLNWMPYASE